MSQRELRKLEGDLLKLDIRIKKLIIKLLKRVVGLSVPKSERKAWLLFGSLACSFLILVVGLMILNH